MQNLIRQEYFVYLLWQISNENFANQSVMCVICSVGVLDDETS